MQFNLVGIQAAQGDDQAGARWLWDLADALTSRGNRVDWWSVEGKQRGDLAPAASSAASPPDAAHVDVTDTATLRGALVSRTVEVWQAASTMLQTHLSNELRAEGEVVVVGHGWVAAPVLMALDQLLRAEQVRYQTLLVWLAPASLRTEPRLSRSLDWERFKRACSIIAPNSTVRQELLAERVGSLVIERGADGARWLSARAVPRALRRPVEGEKRGAP